MWFSHLEWNRRAGPILKNIKVEKKHCEIALQSLTLIFWHFRGTVVEWDFIGAPSQMTKNNKRIIIKLAKLDNAQYSSKSREMAGTLKITKILWH